MRLIEKGIICREGQIYRFLPKNSGDLPKISGDLPKISGNSEKESTKEKENKIKKYLVSKKEYQPTKFFEDVSFSPPTKQEAAEYAQSRNIPLEIVGKWWYYWDENNWTRENGRRIRKWQSALEGFVLREKQAVLQLAGVPQKQVQEVVRNSRNEMIRRQQLEQQNREREQNDRDGVSIPEHLAQRFAKFGKMDK